MQSFKVAHRHDDFEIIGTTARSQAATMVLAPGNWKGAPTTVMTPPISGSTSFPAPAWQS